MVGRFNERGRLFACPEISQVTVSGPEGFIDRLNVVDEVTQVVFVAGRVTVIANRGVWDGEGAKEGDVVWWEPVRVVVGDGVVRGVHGVAHKVGVGDLDGDASYSVHHGGSPDGHMGVEGS